MIAVYLHSKTLQHSDYSIGGSPHDCDWALFDPAFLEGWRARSWSLQVQQVLSVPRLSES